MPDRRHLLRLAAAGIVGSSVPSSLLAAPRVRPAALLVPLTGPSAGLGLSMQRAAAMVQAVGTGRDAGLVAIDCGATPESAAAATTRALRAGAAMILGPVFASQVRAVVATAGGRAPVLTFSNDEALRDSGAFLLGITAAQSAAAILGYARARGIRRVGLPAPASPWAQQVAAVAPRIANEAGLELVTGFDPTRATDAPDALFMPDGGDAFAAVARALQGRGMQLLGTYQAVGAPVSADGAWLAAPDPAAFGDFARDYETRNGGAPGTLAALGYDGSAIVRALRTAGRLDRAGLLATPSFPGVTGALHFREDGTATRELAILVAAPGGGYAVAPA